MPNMTPIYISISSERVSITIIGIPNQQNSEANNDFICLEAFFYRRGFASAAKDDLMSS